MRGCRLSSGVEQREVLGRPAHRWRNGGSRCQHREARDLGSQQEVRETLELSSRSRILPRALPLTAYIAMGEGSKQAHYRLEVCEESVCKSDEPLREMTSSNSSAYWENGL